MKKLVVSCKTADQVFGDFKQAAKNVQRGKIPKAPHYEVSFDNKADFNKFVRNIPILSAITVFKPRSVYELTKFTGIEQKLKWDLRC
jgi:predicted transcriptional regulator